jgi:predicted enzyme related to lactoylglutathione lyase
MFLLNGKMAAAVGPLQSPQQPPAWSTYVCTADASATARKVQAGGGTVVAEPFDVMDQGRMGVFQDPSGAFFSVWQPGAHKGAEVANVAGSFSWNELATRDIDTAKRFYGQVFGWGAETHGDYTEWKVNGRSIAGAMPMGDRYPPQVPPHWLGYFTVEDCDASAAKAQELGGRVMVPPMDVEPGRFAVISDPQGAAFGIIKFKS